MWMVIETDTTVEVIPDYGPEHREGGECWCDPRIEHYDRDLVIHSVPN